MTEERVGGISIEASITDERVDAELNALLAKIKVFAEQATAAATVHVSVSGTQGAPQAAPQRQQREAQPPPISYGAGSATRAAAQQGQTSQIRAINAELAKTGEFFNAQTGQVEKLNAELATTRRTMGSVTRDARTQQAELTQGIADVEPINVTVNTTEAKEQLAAFLAEFKTMVAEAQAGATITVRGEGQAAAGGGGRRGRGRAAAAAAGGDDEEGAVAPGKRRKNITTKDVGTTADQRRIYSYEPTEDLAAEAKSRREREALASRVSPPSAAETDFLAALADANDPRKEAARAREASRSAARAADAARAAQRAKDREDLQGASARMEDQNRGYQPSSTFAPPREERRTAAPEGRQGVFVGTPFTGTDEARSREEWLRGWRSSARGQQPLTPENEPPETGAQQRAREAAAAAALPPVQPYQLPEERARRARQDREVRNRQQDEDAQTSAAFAASARVRQREIDEEQVQRVTRSRRASITAGGQTGRTAAFGLGALFGGNRGAQIEAQEQASQALRQLRGAESAIKPLDDRLKDIARSWQVSTGANRAFNREQFLAIRRSDEYRQALGNVRTALEQDAAAQEKLNKFTAPTSIVRNLLAGAAGGAAYGLALSAVSETARALGPAIGDVIDAVGGFASKSTGVTSALAQQNAAQKGNIDATLAQAAATAGLSTQASDYLATQLKLTTQVKTGALAQQQASDLFRAGAGAGQGVPQGLGGGFGGLFGTPFLAQQLGGGKGFQELIAGDIRNLGGARTSNTGRFGDVPGTVNDILGSLNPFGENFGDPGKQIQLRDQAAALAGNTPELTKYLDDLNASIKRTAIATGQGAKATFEYTQDQERIAQAVAISTAAGDGLGVSMAQMGVILRDAGGGVANFTTQVEALQQAVTGKGITPTEQLGRLALAQEQQRQRESRETLPALQSQFAFERPAFMAGLERQQQFQLNTQLPARAALGALAAPMLAPGTGQVAANADEQERIEKSTAKTQRLQDQLNAYYKQGEQVLKDTYQIPEQLVGSIRATGQAIAETQTKIRNDQAAYQTAQYNYQLIIAKRTLSDIGGLTGRNFGAGQSYLGVLEKQNLALSRQGQLLQFAMAQRQINFQVALAGFQAPGVTPEERQANVKEAELEASFAQKQLDIQTKMFGNQVQIVDIGNLRQGVDLANQIALLVQGRKVTIDTAAAEERLVALGKLQDEQVQRAGTYVEKIDKAVGRAFSEIQALETAAGTAMFNAAIYAAGAFGIFLQGVTTQLGEMRGINPATTGNTGGGFGGHAAGAVFSTTGRTSMTVGEAGSETVAILRNPRNMDGFGGGGGGTVNFNGDIYVRSENDIEEIARKVTRVIGNTGALKGLRSTN